VILYSTGNFVSGQTWYLGPEDARRRRAYTGDSAIYDVSLAPYGTRWTVSHVEAELISHYIDDERNVVVEYLRELAHLPAADPWRDFYRLRHAVMRRFADDPQLRLFDP
jgi:poly-gamma-glutamate synthesis protein (capsule biosynthesis protein)